MNNDTNVCMNMNGRTLAQQLVYNIHNLYLATALRKYIFNDVYWLIFIPIIIMSTNSIA